MSDRFERPTRDRYDDNPARPIAPGIPRGAKPRPYVPPFRAEDLMPTLPEKIAGKRGLAEARARLASARAAAVVKPSEPLPVPKRPTLDDEELAKKGAQQ